MNKKKIVLLLAIIVVFILFFYFDLQNQFDLQTFKIQYLGKILDYRSEFPVATGLVFFAVYVVITAFSLPGGAVVMTLAAGAIFDLFWGTAIVSFASTIGATLAFLASRYLFRDWVQQRFSARLKAFNDGFKRDGSFYLFTLRLFAGLPFFAINLLMGLTSISVWRYYWVSQIGMLAGTIVYVNAGTQIAKIDSASGILTWPLILSFALLGIFPLLTKRVVEYLKANKVYKNFPRPKQYEANLVVIGAGSAGLVSAYIASAIKAKVILIEEDKMGGDCLNSGCVPSKALIRSARLLSDIQHSAKFGIRSVKAEFDFSDIMARVQKVIKEVEPHDSVERYTELGVECIKGRAKINTPFEVEVAGRKITTRNIIIAAGGKPRVPELLGMDKINYLTSDTIWTLNELPEKLLVLGGGPIGCELALCFARFGSKVSIVQRRSQLLPREDFDVAEYAMKKFKDEGIKLYLGFSVKEFLIEGDKEFAICADREGKEEKITFDKVLVASGREPNTKGYGLEELDIPLSERGAIEVDKHLQTRFPNIYACGDVVGPYLFTHMAAHQAWYASVNALFGKFKKYQVDYSIVPWCTFIDPEIARVGLNEIEAKAQGIAFEVVKYELSDLDRAIADSRTDGLVKVLTIPGKDKILGATIVGEHAGELITEYVSAMKNGFGLEKILGTIHIYPTMSEANKYVAGNWKKAHKPETVLKWLEKFHKWRRK